MSTLVVAGGSAVGPLARLLSSRRRCRRFSAAADPSTGPSPAGPGGEVLTDGVIPLQVPWLSAKLDTVWPNWAEAPGSSDAGVCACVGCPE